MGEDKPPRLDLSETCACGAISVAISGRPRAMLLCACTECQKATGAGHSAVAIFAADAVSIAGDTTRYERAADSGARLVRRFCPRCGTPICAQSSRWPEALLMPVGLFANADWFDPSQVIFHRSHQKWDTLPDVAFHETYRPA